MSRHVTQWHYMISMLGNQQHFPFPRFVHHPEQKCYTHYIVTPHSLCRQQTATSLLVSSSTDLSIPEMSGTWNHTTCGFCVWLLSLSAMFSRFMHSGVRVTVSSLSRLNNLPMCRQTTLRSSIPLLIDICVVFHILAIVNDIAVNGCTRHCLSPCSS